MTWLQKLFGPIKNPTLSQLKLDLEHARCSFEVHLIRRRRAEAEVKDNAVQCTIWACKLERLQASIDEYETNGI